MMKCMSVRFLFRASVIILFFFFKQKTAYEMRISDWNSDVCSSDLVAGSALTPVAAAARDASTLARERLRRLSRYVSGNRDAVEWDDQHQIGRASCRERVCQYV